MAQTRPGIERMDKLDLQAERRVLASTMSQHEKMCITCRTASDDPYMRCDEWWRNARRLHHVRRRLQRYVSDIDPDQPTLPGMEIP